MTIQNMRCPAKDILSKISCGKPRLNAKNISEEVAEMLSDKIIRAEIKPGERILEAKVSKELGISQSSLREALRVLEQNGLVEINPRRGTYVRHITRTDVEITYDVLSNLYQLITKKAMESENEKLKADLIEAADEFDRNAAQMGFEDFYRSMFDLVLFGLSVINSSVLTKVTLDLLPVKRRIEYMTLSARKDNMAPLLKQFRLIKKLIIAGDSDGLCRAIGAFLEEEKKTALAAIG